MAKSNSALSDMPSIVTSQSPTADTLQKLAETKQKIQSTFGQIVLAMCVVPRYRNLLLSELQQLVLDPLSHDKIVLALPGNPQNDPTIAAAPATIAIWASVSEAVDKRIREQTAAGVFPVRLRPEDWSSGEIVWLLDVIAPSEKMATEVLKSFRQVTKKDALNVHPVVTRLVDQKILETLSSAAQDDRSI